MPDTRRVAGSDREIFDDGAQPDMRIIDPGKEGWAPEPRVTQAELLLYGDLAGVVRRLGEAASAASDAFSLVCKHAKEAEDAGDTSYSLDYEIQRVWRAYEQMLDVFRELPVRAAARLEMRLRPYRPQSTSWASQVLGENSGSAVTR